MIDFIVSPAMLTDQHELTMAQDYFQNSMFGSATFSLFVREYPPHRGCFVTVGLEDVLEFWESYCFSKSDMDYLAATKLFSLDFLHYLSSIRFSGSVRAIPEGRVFFIDEPILEISGPIIEARMVSLPESPI